MQGSVTVKRTPAGVATPIKTENKSKMAPVTQKDLNHHLSRVMKLIQTREDTRNGSFSPDLYPSSQRPRNFLADNSDIVDRQNIKRSVTPMQSHSYHKNSTSNQQVSVLDTNQQERAPRNNKGFGKLRIVKSIHHTNMVACPEETSDLVTSGDVLSQDALSIPMIVEPIGYFSHQQKRSFVPDPTKLMLQGKTKPKLQRNHKKDIMQNSKTAKSKQQLPIEMGCQTSPILRDNIIENTNQSKMSEVDGASTQQNSRDNLQELKIGSFWNQSQIKVNIPNKIIYRESSMHSSSKNDLNLKEEISHHQQRNYKMSLLKSSQAQANDKFFLPIDKAGDGRSTTQNQTASYNDHYRRSKHNSSVVSASQAFQTSQQFNPTNPMHMATRMSQKYNRKQQRFLKFKDQDLHQDVFSWNNQSFISPTSDANNNDLMQGFIGDDNEMTRAPQLLSQSSRQQKQNYPRQPVLNSRTRTPNIHVTGAFKDHSTKPIVTDRDLSRSNIRANQLSKTQQFFMQASKTPDLDNRHKGNVGMEQQSEIEDVIGRDKTNFIRIKVKESMEAVDDSMLADLEKPLQNTSTTVQFQHQETAKNTNLLDYINNNDSLPKPKIVEELQDAINDSEATTIQVQQTCQQESIVSFLDKKRGSDLVLDHEFGGEVDYQDADDYEDYLSESINMIPGQKRNKKLMQEVESWRPSEAMDEALEMIDQQLKATTTQCSSSIAVNRYQQNNNSSLFQPQQQTKSGINNKHKILMIETRLLKQMQRDLDKKEYQIYSRYGLDSQRSYNITEAHLFNLVEHPEWSDLTQELQDIYLSIFEDFNHQLIAQNYFIRKDINRTKANNSLHQTSRNSNTQQQQSSTQQNKLTNQRSEFIQKFMSRIKNLFQQHQRLQLESTKQLNYLKSENARLESECATLRQGDKKIKDARTVINEIINQYFQMGHDQDVRSERVKEADQYLNSEPLVAIADCERYERVSRLDYSNVLSRLERVVIDLQMPSILNSGVKFEMSDHKFDPDFKDSIKQLFSGPVQTAQYDSALRALTMVYKATKFVEVGVQVQEGDVDKDLLVEINFQKENVVRLQQEINAMMGKVKANEKAMKAAIREKQDAIIMSQTFETQLQNERQDVVRSSNLVAQYKSMHAKSQNENDQLSMQVGKITTQVDRFKRYDKLAEKAMEKLTSMVGRKDILIKDLDGLLEMLQYLATADQQIKINAVRTLKKKIESKNSDMKKALIEFQNRDRPMAKKSTMNVQRSRLQPQSQMSGFSVADTGEAALDPEMLEYERQKNTSVPRQRQQPKGPLGSINQITELVPGSMSKETSHKIHNRNNSKFSSKRGSQISDDVDLSDEEFKEIKLSYSRTAKKSDAVKRADKFNNPSRVKELELRVELQLSENFSDSRSLGEIQESDDEQSITLDLEDSDEPKKQSPKKQNKKKKVKVTAFTKFNLPELMSPTSSKQTEGLNSDRYEEDNDIEVIKGFNNRDIHINCSVLSEEKSQLGKVDQGIQTDTEMFFQYIFQFLGELERRISSGEISVDDILAMGRLAFGEKLEKEGKEHQGSHSWGYQSPGKQKKQMQFSIQELQECLRRLRSLSSYGGDIFFAGIAKTMVTKPIIPQSYNATENFHLRSPAVPADPNDPAMAALVKAGMENLQSMTKVRHSTGGGSGAAKNPSSPNKAQKASNAIGSGNVFRSDKKN